MDSEHKLIPKAHDTDPETLYAYHHFYQYNIITATEMGKEICQSIEIDVKVLY